MKEEVETATFCWRVPDDHGSLSVRSSRLLLAGTMLATGVTRRWSSAMVFPWSVCLCVLWRTLWRRSVAEWTCVHHRQHVGDALSGHLRAPGPCACLVVRAPTSLLTAQGRKTNLWTEGCSKCWQFKFVDDLPATSFHGTVPWAPTLLVTRLSETCRSKRLVQCVVDSNGCWFRSTTARWTCSAKQLV